MKVSNTEVIEKILEDETGYSKQVIDEPFKFYEHAGKVLRPPYSINHLTKLVEYSNELNQCIEAMEINIEGFGHRILSRINIDAPDVPQKLKDEVTKERIFLENFFEYCVDRDSFISLRRKTRWDLELTGNA